MYSGVGRLGSFGGIKRKMSGREWFVSNEQTCGGMRGGEDISWDAMWDVWGQNIMFTVLLITNVHHDNETTFATAENGFDNLACSLVVTVRVHASNFGAPCSSMMAAVLTVTEKTATMRR